jgi:hypothetical protein
MALEKWLLEVAKSHPDHLDMLMLRLLQQSESAAITAVVASVATAFPYASGEALLAILHSPECIMLDTHRFGKEIEASSLLDIARIGGRDELFTDERKEANALSHRNQRLENAILNLQLRALASRVHEILDQHIAVLPPLDGQNTKDLFWRFALHRMDLRRYSMAEDKDEGRITPGTDEAHGETSTFIRLESDELAPDLKEVADDFSAQHASLNAGMGLFVWGKKVFDHEQDDVYNQASWRARLSEARESNSIDLDNPQSEMFSGGPGFVAAICVRDHWDELSVDEQDWCINTICSEIEAENKDGALRADQPCASVLPLLFGKPLAEELRACVNRAFAVALTHPSDEVRGGVASGIGKYLWEIDSILAKRCVNAIAQEATLIQMAWDVEEKRPFLQRRQLEEIEAYAAASIRQQFYIAGGITDDALMSMDPARWFGAEANRRILTILGQAPDELMAVATYERFAHTLVEWWDTDEQRRFGRDHEREERNLHTEPVLTRLLENFLLRTTTVDAVRIMAPLVDAVDRHPEKVHWFLKGLVGVEDVQPNTQQFWTLWMKLADAVRQARWLARIDDEYAFGREMVLAIFLSTGWKRGVRHWRSVEGYAEHIHALFQDLPASAYILDSYLRFLYHAGEQSLPDAFIYIAERLQHGNPRDMMRDGNTIYLLEDLLGRHVYGKPLELKRRSDLRDAVLALLDMLVEQGSSAAFRMRDDFVTPLPPL